MLELVKNTTPSRTSRATAENMRGRNWLLLAEVRKYIKLVSITAKLPLGNVRLTKNRKFH